MVSRDDPFGLDEDTGRTRVRPVASAGHRSPRNATHAPLQPREHPNPLIGAFASLLAFAPELESPTAPSDPETLRTRLLDTLISSRDAAVASATRNAVVVIRMLTRASMMRAAVRPSAHARL